MDARRDSASADSDEYPQIDKFIFCFPLGRHLTSGCGGLMSLRTALLFSSSCDGFLGLCYAIRLGVHLSSSRDSEDDIGTILYASIFAVMLAPAIACVVGAFKSNAWKIAHYYYAKTAQFFAFLAYWLILAIMGLPSFGTVLLLLLLKIIILFQALLSFSYINLVSQGFVLLALFVSYS